MRYADRIFNAGEEFGVTSGALAALLIPARKMTQFHAENTRLYRVEPSVISFDIVEVLFRLPVVAQHPDLASQGIIVRCDGAGLSAGAEILARIKAECGCGTHGARLTPAIVFH